MSNQVAERDTQAGEDARERLLAAIPADERREELAGISTAFLETGEGPPIVLLHGPGEFGGTWMRVIPELAESHHVIAPDLPAHGASELPQGDLDAERMIDWLDQLIKRTCSSPPVLVGHVLGGAVATRFAIEHSDRLAHLVLVDSLGLARFRPKPRFALTMLGFQMRPNEQSYDRFMRQCSLNLDGLRSEMGDSWEPFVAYNLANARSPKAKAIGRLMRKVGLPRIPRERLAQIATPTTLIWGRQDKANRLKVAEVASERYGWGLEVIDDCADDPARDQPEAFLRALDSALAPQSR